MAETQLELAQRHVLESRKIIEQQKRLIERRKKSGLDTTSAEALLRSFESSLEIFERDLAVMAESRSRPI